MDLKGEYRINASRENVWKMINDPEVLKACIPGCESLQGSPDDGFSARVTTKRMASRSLSALSCSISDTVTAACPSRSLE